MKDMKRDEWEGGGEEDWKRASLGMYSLVYLRSKYVVTR